jgi:hypothetical protein
VSEVAKRKREGTFLQRQMAPVLDDADARLGARLAEADKVAARTVGDIARQGSRATRDIERVGRVVTRRGAIGLGLGVAGGMTVGEAGRQGVQRAFNRKPKAQPASQGPRERPLRVVGKADLPGMGEYPFLLPSIRQETQLGIPATRLNPISPMQMLAASNITADGLLKVRSRNPIGRAKRTREGVQRMTIGASMGVQPLGYGVIQP